MLKLSSAAPSSLSCCAWDTQLHGALHSRMLHLFAVLMVLIYSTHPKASTSGAHLAQTVDVAQCSHQKISRNELMPI